MNDNAATEIAQYLTFGLGEEEFALELSKVREIMDYTTITRVPRMPQFLRGVINLRGNVVPVIDLRLKLGMSATEKTVDTCIVIMEIMVDGEAVDMGALADSVQEVIELDPAEIEPPPRLGTKLNTEFIQGMGKRDDKFLIILNIDKVLAGDELELIHDKSESSVMDMAKHTVETEALPPDTSFATTPAGNVPPGL
ncbi:purine-binding chemotaxis protein CheW [Desulfosarcina sp. BuS5]|uniref:chemotaxis protein CheW n=1 Tax=Desulfosarcina sp. BuS5 TaxID=933262 RepID=UPI0009FCF23D|nr:chemotaxis protein CheW [Desulfosarcina sp. BuS5]WDN89353.1 purine-binding chemotaxis protein CheW [Desulfosarcina sp. BuS5]